MSSSKPMDFYEWWKSLNCIAKDAGLDYLLSNDGMDHIKQYDDGETPKQAMQALYEDAGCPLRAADAAGATE